MMEEPSIEVKNVTKYFRLHHQTRSTLFEYLFSGKNNSYETLTVLDNVSFTVKKGEMLGIIGFNGIGKTTLLRIIGKIYTPNKGTVITRGKVTPFLELGTGFNGELSAKDNIILYGIILGFSKKEIVKRIDEIIKFAELEKFLDTKLKNFSAGMYARLAFSTAIQVDPDILLVDEILSVGDISFQEKSFRAFSEFRKQGKTIVFVSHSIEKMKKLCDKVILLHNGSIYAQGDPIQVLGEYEKLASERMNLAQNREESSHI